MGNPFSYVITSATQHEQLVIEIECEDDVVMTLRDEDLSNRPLIHVEDCAQRILEGKSVHDLIEVLDRALKHFLNLGE
jgi:hypothetical protein